MIHQTFHGPKANKPTKIFIPIINPWPSWLHYI